MDGEVVRRHGLQVRELFGGCICCTLQVGLVETLRDIETELAPDYAVVEPTGLAAPGDVVATVRGLMPSLESITTLTLVDAERWEMLWEVVEPLVTAQVEAADVVAVNKVDVAGAEATAAARAAVRRLNPTAPVLVTDASSGAGLDALYAAVRP